MRRVKRACSCEAGLPEWLVTAQAPTRELAQQICEDASTWGGDLDALVVCGGTDRNAQMKRLKRKPCCVVATPGRLVDLIEAKAAVLKDVRVAVLDEADRMLDMGFADALNAIHSAMTFPERQTLFFSATWPKAVRKLAATYARRGAPLVVSVGGAAEASNGLAANTSAVTKRRAAFLLRVAWGGRVPEHLSETLANFESGLTSGRLPHRRIRGSRSRFARSTTRRRTTRWPTSSRRWTTPTASSVSATRNDASTVVAVPEPRGAFKGHVRCAQRETVVFLNISAKLWRISSR